MAEVVHTSPSPAVDVGGGGAPVDAAPGSALGSPTGGGRGASRPCSAAALRSTSSPACPAGANRLEALCGDWLAALSVSAAAAAAAAQTPESAAAAAASCAPALAPAAAPPPAATATAAAAAATAATAAAATATVAVPAVAPWHLRAAHDNAAAAAVLASFGCARLPAGGVHALSRHASGLIAAHRLDDTAYVYDLGNPLRLWRAWRAALPRVHPFYAVKCNPEPAVLRLLAALGCGFDCASKAELEAVLRLGVPRDRIIFAHPCKRPSDLRFARDAGVGLTTFDTASELRKVAAACPGVGLVLRVRADDPEARVPLGLKYGADPAEAPGLLRLARALGLAVVGASFHVGSACRNPAAFGGAIAAARRVFDAGEAEGFAMGLLDIGGGFAGRFDAHGHVVLGDIAAAVNAALARHFPLDGGAAAAGGGGGGGAGRGVRVISEPGRYFAEASATLLTPVYGTRDRVERVVAAGGGGGGGSGGSGGGAGAGAGASSLPSAAPPGAACAATTVVQKDYWITDGLYGSFNCILYDDQKPTAHVLRSPLLPPLPPPGVAAATAGTAAAGTSGGAGGDASGAAAAEPLYPSTLWGPTCDSADFVYKDVALPALRNGDWVVWPNAGAYTVAGACDFNGLEATRPRNFYVCSDCAVDGAEEEQGGASGEAPPAAGAVGKAAAP